MPWRASRASLICTWSSMRRSHRSQSRSISPGLKNMASNQATFAGRRPHWWLAKKPVAFTLPSGRMMGMGGASVPGVRVAPTPNVVEHENLKRRLDARANVRGRDLGSVVADVVRRLQEVEFPLGYYPELIGEFQERQAAQRSILIVSVVSMIGIFLILQVSFGSWRLATLSFLTLPSALVGGVLAAYFSEGIISLGSLVGFLTILGIAARNGIMLIDHFQHLERYEGETFGPALVLRGARERISPIMMTALTSALAIMPLVAAGSIPGHEIEHPLAVVVLGGLVTSTLLNLFVVPSLYLRFGTSREPDASSVQAR